MTTQLPPDELIANILHTLKKTNVSPLLISCKSKSPGVAKWDLLLYFQELHRNEGRPTHRCVLASLLESFLSGHRDVVLGDEFCVRDEDMSLWIQGLSVLHSIISSEDTVPVPHELLTAVMDSYYCRDDDERDLPTFDSMFVLRSLISAHAIQSAESSTRHLLQYSETIRWKRLKSMVEDTITLYQRMLFEGFENAGDTVENDTRSQPGSPAQFITIASWIYTKQIFPACQSLVSLLLEEDHGNCISNLKEGLVAKLFGMLTTLLALDCTSVVTDRGADLINTDRLVFATITNSDKFFTNARSYEAQLSGLSLEEDLLLYDRPHCNKLGLATIAFIKLQTQLHPSTDAALPSPSPLSAEYRWALSFPHVITFLTDDEASHVKLGFYMLQMLTNETHFIRPAQCCTHNTNSAYQRAHSTELLAHTLHTLLSLVLRISAMEASMLKSSSVLEYSSLQAITLAQKLVKLYDVNVQVQVINKVSQNMRDSDQGLIALLPKVLDWLRPVIMDVCNKSKYNSQDVILLCEVVSVFDPLLMGLEEVFDDSTTLPQNISTFFSMIEAYTSLLSSLRAMKTFIHTDNKPECERLSFISEWMKQALDRFILFKERLEKLIDFWSYTETSSPPPGHHRCLLLHYHLEEAVLELSGEGFTTD